MLASPCAAGAHPSPAPGSQDHAAHHPPGAAPAAAAPADRMTMMDTQMKAKRAMHEKMSRASTPEERDALMAEHMKLMQEGMAMMGGMGGMRGIGAMGTPGAPMDMTTRHQMMEKRMEMMQSTMQMMMDRMGAPAAKP